MSAARDIDSPEVHDFRLAVTKAIAALGTDYVLGALEALLVGQADDLAKVTQHLNSLTARRVS